MAYTNIDKSDDYFNTKLYAGTSATNSVTGVGFQPDFVWIKDRDRVTYHFLFNAISGATNWLATNTTGAEQTFTDTLTSFNSDGFTLGTNGDVNGSPYNFVSWNWLANGAGVSNTAGSITSTVSANTTSGFSIVSYTGTGSSATVGHGLGVAPKMIIIKNRSSVTNWLVYHASLGNGNSIVLNTTGTSFSAGDWQNTTPTSSIIYLSGGTAVNESSSNHIAYCFAEKKGFSKFGSYTGNGNADGTFVYTGFKPAFIIIKRTDVAQSWILFDNKRDPYNEATKVLYPNLTNAEDANNLDLLSNGFKPRSTSSFTNSSGNNFIYMAFAEHPFVTSTSIPTTAR
jgi:hypothetical protein